MGGELVKMAMSEKQIERRRELQGRFLALMLEKDVLDYREAAKLASKGDPKKAKAWRQRWRAWEKDPDFQGIIAEVSLARLRGNLLQLVEALNRRANKGNVPAIKLALEVSGFWSPRTTHDHTGEIAVVLKGGHRPPAVTDEDPVVDATVVE